MKTAILLSVFAALLGGCSSTSPPTRWTKFGYNHQEFVADWAQCQKEEAPAACMRAKGYAEDTQ